MKSELGIIGADFGHIHMATVELIKLHMEDTVTFVNVEDEVQKIREHFEMQVPIKPLALPLIETAFVPDYRPSKHHCQRKPKPRRNKAQAKARRKNRK